MTGPFVLPPLLDSAPVALAVVGAGARVIAVNRTLRDDRHLSVDGGLLDRVLTDLLEPESPSREEDGLAAVLAGTQESYAARRLYRGRGGLRDIDLRVSMLPDAAAGAGRLCMAALHDVTDQARAAAAAGRHAAEMDAIFRSLPAAIYIGDQNGISLANDAALSQLGYATVDQLNRHVSELSEQLQNRDALTGERIDWSDEPFIRALGGERVDREIISVHQTSREDVVQRVIAVPIEIEGLIAGAVAINSNVTDRRRMEEALRLSEARYRALVEQAPLSIQILTPDGRTVQVNSAWETLWGVSRDQISDYNLLEDPQLEARGLAPLIREAFAGEARELPATPYDTEQTLPGRSANEDPVRWVRAVIYPLKDERGKVREVVLIHVDITDQMRARHELEAASRTKDDFLATLSHELRTPLNAVLGWTHMLRSREQDAETRHGLEVIHRNAQAQARMIDDLLDMSRIVAGKLTLQPARLQPAAVIAAAVESIRPAVDARGLTLATEVVAALPDVHADPERLQQVLWNLLSNAVKFTPANGTITVTAAADRGAVLITVRDTGSGVPADILPFVFDRFTQADVTSTRANRGLGLGLAIVRHLVELHGGTVSASSEGADRGATFSVSLPAAPPAS